MTGKKTRHKKKKTKLNGLRRDDMRDPPNKRQRKTRKSEENLSESGEKRGAISIAKRRGCAKQGMEKSGSEKKNSRWGVLVSWGETMEKENSGGGTQGKNHLKETRLEDEIWDDEKKGGRKRRGKLPSSKRVKMGEGDIRHQQEVKCTKGK